MSTDQKNYILYKMAKIAQVDSEEILDSRGNPTVQTRIILKDGAIGVASVPSGASKSKYEAVELRDGDTHHFGGLGVTKAVENVLEQIKPVILGREASNQEDLDKLLIEIDGTENKANLGANAILSVSLAAAVAQSHSQKTPLYRYLNSLINVSLPDSQPHLPTPMFNLINGGKHGSGGLDIQEFLVIPSEKLTYDKALEVGVTIFKQLKVVLMSRGESTSTGDEGGYTPDITNTEALERLTEAIRASHETISQEFVRLGLDVAGSQLLRGDRYFLREEPKGFSLEEFMKFLLNLKDSYNLLTIEDPLSEEDWDNWVKITKQAGDTLIVADDLVSTNPKRLAKCVKLNAATGVIIKLNQIGTLSETLNVALEAKKAKMKIIVSHRSGEVDDVYLADLSVALAAEFIKAGAPYRGERVAKYNRLLEIEKELSDGK